MLFKVTVYSALVAFLFLGLGHTEDVGSCVITSVAASRSISDAAFDASIVQVLQDIAPDYEADVDAEEDQIPTNPNADNISANGWLENWYARHAGMLALYGIIRTEITTYFSVFISPICSMFLVIPCIILLALQACLLFKVLVTLYIADHIPFERLFEQTGPFLAAIKAQGISSFKSAQHYAHYAKEQVDVTTFQLNRNCFLSGKHCGVTSDSDTKYVLIKDRDGLHLIGHLDPNVDVDLFVDQLMHNTPNVPFNLVDPNDPSKTRQLADGEKFNVEYFSLNIGNEVFQNISALPRDSNYVAAPSKKTGLVSKYKTMLSFLLNGLKSYHFCVAIAGDASATPWGITTQASFNTFGPASSVCDTTDLSDTPFA